MRFDEPTLRFLGVVFQAADVQTACARVEALLHAECEGTLVVHANLNTVHRAQSDPDLMAALAHPAALVLFEGIGLKVARWLVTGLWCPDTNGTDLVPAVLSRHRAAPLRVALIGGARGVAVAAAEHLQASQRQILIVGAWDGFEDCESESTLLGALTEARPDLVLLGLGTPRQEKLGARWLEPAGARVVWAVGGLLDLWAGRKRRAPALWRAMRVEWLWRLLAYPRAYGGRYATQGAWLVAQVLRAWGRAARRRWQSPSAPSAAVEPPARRERVQASEAD